MRFPSAVLERARAITTVLRTRPDETSVAARPTATRSVTAHPDRASDNGLPLILCRSSSKPARNMRNVSPRSDSPVATGPRWARFSTEGPMRIPSRIWMTTSGTRAGPVSSERIGAMTAATTIRTSPLTETVTTTQTGWRLGRAPVRPAPLLVGVGQAAIGQVAIGQLDIGQLGHGSSH